MRGFGTVTRVWPFHPHPTLAPFKGKEMIGDEKSDGGIAVASGGMNRVGGAMHGASAFGESGVEGHYKMTVENSENDVLQDA